VDDSTRRAMPDAGEAAACQGCVPDGLIYRVQEKAWFSEAIMLEWVEAVIKPYVAKMPPGIVPILFLDSLMAERNISKVSIKNACRKTGLSWFPHLPNEI
jgi:hypothetical protein